MEEQNEGDTENIFIMLHTIICKLYQCAFQYSATKGKVK